MGKNQKQKQKRPFNASDVKAKRRKASHASSSKSLKEESKANLEKQKIQSEIRDEYEPIVPTNEFDGTKESSKPTSIATTGASSSKSLKEGNSSKSQANLEKQKIHKEEKSEKRDEDDQIVSRVEFEELKESMKESMKELSQAMKTLHEILLTKAAQLLEVPVKEKETPKEMEEPKFTCCFEYEDMFKGCDTTLFVKGFENLRPMEEIRKELREIFGSCGEVTRVFVPFQCGNRLPLGFAFIDLKNGQGNDKALKLSGSCMGGKELKVTMAKQHSESYGFSDFNGCDRCLEISMKREMEAFKVNSYEDLDSYEELCSDEEWN